MTTFLNMPAVTEKVHVLNAARLTEDIHAIVLDAAPVFKAGQYVMMSIADLPAKPFSIASAPHHPHLEFHIRDTGQGPGSAALKNLKTGDMVGISAPTGQAYLRDGGRPLLALAGGLGITPLKSILETHLSAPAGRPHARLYWTAYKGEGLYLDTLFSGKVAEHKDFSYIPLATIEPEALSAALARDFPTLEEFDIYLSGPRAMVTGLLPFLASRGAKRAHIFGDGVEVAS